MYRTVQDSLFTSVSLLIQNKGQHLLSVPVGRKILESLKNPCVDTNGSLSNGGEGRD